MIQARKRIMSIIEEEISDRRRGLGANQHEDFLGSLLADDDKACYEAGPNRQKLLDSEIQDNILTMIIAGQN